MKTIEVTIQEIQAATRPNVYRNRKKYTRKDKHRNKVREDWFVYWSINKEIKVMKKVLLVFSLALMSVSGVLLAGGNDLGYVGFFAGMVGLYIVDRKLVLGE